MKTCSQQFAVKAWDLAHASSLRPDFQKTQYGGTAHNLPVTIQSCGLVQALSFVLARGKDSHHYLLDDLAVTLGYNDKRALWSAAKDADLAQYIYLSEQAIEALLWFKRFAQSELNVDAGADANLSEDGGDG